MTTATRLGANLPVAAQADGSPIVSRIRIEYSSDLAQQPAGAAGLYTVPLKGNGRFVSYETADTGAGRSTLTVRDAINGERRPVAGDRWAFDAVRIHIPGSHRLFANVEFADPNIYSRQDRTPDFTSQSYPPLTYAVTTDPVTNVRDGILKRPATDPLVFHVDTSNEFWQMKASLNVHDGRGDPVPIPDNVRLYLLASHPHGGAAGVGARPTGRGACAYVTNTYRSAAPAMRALLVALDDWADRGIEPPASAYPDVRRGTLATVDEVARMFPAIPGVAFPTRANGLDALDFGPMFGSGGGRQTVLPPTRGGSYQVLVPTTDRDGHDVAGIHTVDVAAPVGTNTGWNLLAPGPRGRDLCSLTGSFFPFARTRAERLASGDPRLSLEERYGDHAGFVAAVRDAADESVARRLLLSEDAEVLVGMAEESDVLR